MGLHMMPLTTSLEPAMRWTSYQETKTALEEMIDAQGLRTLLAMLSEICGEKQEHVASNWQDEESAKNWRKADVALARCANNLPR